VRTCRSNAQVHLRASQIKASEASNPKIARQVKRSLYGRTVIGNCDHGHARHFTRLSGCMAGVAEPRRISTKSPGSANRDRSISVIRKADMRFLCVKLVI